MDDAADLIGEFLTLAPQTVLRYDAPATLTDGEFVKPTPDTITVDMSVQPLTMKEIQNLPEGQRTKRAFKAYCAAEMFTANQVTGVPADIVAYDGSQFEVQGTERWVGDFNHWKIVMVEVNP